MKHINNMQRSLLTQFILVAICFIPVLADDHMPIMEDENRYETTALVVKSGNGAKDLRIYMFKGDRSKMLPAKELAALLSDKRYPKTRYFMVFVSGGNDDSVRMTFSLCPLREKEGKSLVQIVERS